MIHTVGAIAGAVSMSYRFLVRLKSNARLIADVIALVVKSMSQNLSSTGLTKKVPFLLRKNSLLKN